MSLENILWFLVIILIPILTVKWYNCLVNLAFWSFKYFTAVFKHISFLIIIIKSYVPAGDIFRCVASLLFLVINSSVATTLFAWCYSVQTDIKLLTVIWMSKFRMIDNHSSGIDLTFFRTFETVFQLLVYYSTSL